MARKIYACLLAAEVVICIALSVLFTTRSTGLSSLITFPFEQIGIGLRALSLSSGIGNVFAIVLFVSICLIPAALLFLILRNRRLHPEDWLLGFLCACRTALDAVCRREQRVKRRQRSVYLRVSMMEQKNGQRRREPPFFTQLLFLTVCGMEVE